MAEISAHAKLIEDEKISMTFPDGETLELQTGDSIRFTTPAGRNRYGKSYSSEIINAKITGFSGRTYPAVDRIFYQRLENRRNGSRRWSRRNGNVKSRDSPYIIVNGSGNSFTRGENPFKLGDWTTIELVTPGFSEEMSNNLHNLAYYAPHAAGVGPSGFTSGMPRVNYRFTGKHAINAAAAAASAAAAAAAAAPAKKSLGSSTPTSVSSMVGGPNESIANRTNPLLSKGVTRKNRRF